LNRRAEILAVEDEAVTAMAIASTLRRLGYEVWLASEGYEALALAESKRVELALLDIRLQGTIDGIEVGTQIRRRFDIPCVFLTAYGDESTFGRACAAEPLGYLQKPFQKDELRNTIEIALHRHRQEKERAAMLNLMGSVLDGRDTGVIVADAARRIRFLNRQGEILTGFTKGMAEGRNVGDVLQLAGKQGLLESLMRAPSAGEAAGSSSVQAVLVARNGITTAVEVSTARAVDQNGRDCGVYILFRDDVEPGIEARHAMTRDARSAQDTPEQTDAEAAEVPNEPDTPQAKPAPQTAAGGTELEKAIRRGRHEFAVCYAVERFQLMRSKFGPKLAQRLLEFYSVHIAQQLQPGDQILYWSDCSFLVLLDRPADSVEEVRRILARAVSSRLEYYAETGTRTALVTVTGKWKLLPLPDDDETLPSFITEVNEFVATVG
jgi:PAS domain S-box-containing protein